MGDVTELSNAAEEVAMSALIEDYFFVNDEEILIEEREDTNLIPAFCITGPSVFKFELALNLVDNVTETSAMLLINDEIVAEA